MSDVLNNMIDKMENNAGVKAATKRILSGHVAREPFDGRIGLANPGSACPCCPICHALIGWGYSNQYEHVEAHLDWHAKHGEHVSG